MRNYLARLGLVFITALSLAPTAALARPVVHVSVGLPSVVIAPAPPPRVVYRPRAPGANFMWVEGTWRRDAYGRPIFVNGYWAPRPVVVHRVPVRTVIVRRY